MKEKMMMGLEGVGIGLSLIILALRLYVGHLKSWRPHRIELFGVVTFSLAVVFAMYIFIHYTVDGVRIGRWRANGDDDDMISAKLLTDTDFKYIYITNLAAVSSLWFAKASFLSSYAGTYQCLGAKLKALYVVTTIYTVLTYFGSMGASAFGCMPIDQNWDVDSPNFCSTVLKPGPVYAVLALNVTSDFLLLLIPLLILFGMMQRRRSEVWGVTVLLLLGTISIVITIYRFIRLEISSLERGLSLSKRNVYIIQTMIMIVSMLAAFVIPSLRVFVRNKSDASKSERSKGFSSSGRSGKGTVNTFGELDFSDKGDLATKSRQEVKEQTFV